METYKLSIRVDENTTLSMDSLKAISTVALEADKEFLGFSVASTKRFRIMFSGEPTNIAKLENKILAIINR